MVKKKSNSVLPRRLTADVLPQILADLDARGYGHSYGIQPQSESDVSAWSAANVVWLLHHRMQEGITQSEFARRNRHHLWELSKVVRHHVSHMLTTVPNEDVPEPSPHTSADGQADAALEKSATTFLSEKCHWRDYTDLEASDATAILRELCDLGVDMQYVVKLPVDLNPIQQSPEHCLWLLQHLSRRGISLRQWARYAGLNTENLADDMQITVRQIVLSATNPEAFPLSAPALTTPTETAPAASQSPTDSAETITTAAIGESMIVTCGDQTMCLPRAVLRDSIITVDVTDDVPVLQISTPLHAAATIASPQGCDPRIMLLQFKQLVSRLCQFAWETAESPR